MIFYVPVAYILYLGNLEYSNYPSILGCMFPGFLIAGYYVEQDIIFS
jgi:hypothetical protein